MPFIDLVFGDGKDLNALQMSCRGFTVFILTLVFLRISGRRSFGMRTPLDNIIVILLGAVLSRAVVGASPFVPVMVCSLVIVVLHRLLAWGMVKSPFLSTLIQGRHLVLFDNGVPVTANMDKALVCQRDLELAIRNKSQTEDFDKVSKLYMEHNGEISVIKKEQS
jgi:uncharacterized membrane protein YcaP (DUF421 family)